MSEDFLPLNGTDHIEFYCGNAKQSAYFYQHAFGFELVVYSGPETGVRDRASYVLQQNKIRFVLTTALSPDHEITRQVAKHGDGVKVLALWVDDAEKAFYETMARGAKAHTQPRVITDEYGEVKIAAIHKVLSVGAMWPYATTVFDNVRRRMPMPKSLTDDEVYGITAHLLHLNRLVAGDAVMDKENLPQVVMPGRDRTVSAWPQER